LAERALPQSAVAFHPFADGGSNYAEHIHQLSFANAALVLHAFERYPPLN
jgi:hypothetical protein